MQESLIVEEFANAGYQVSPDAVALIGSYSAPDTIVSKVLQSLDDSVLVVGREHINIRSFLRCCNRLMIRCLWWGGSISTSVA